MLKICFLVKGVPAFIGLLVGLLFLSPVYAETLQGHGTASSLKTVSFEDTYFDFGDATPQESSTETLKTNLQIIIALQTATVVLQGHTDNRGTDEYNTVLGEKRARSVERHLITAGVSPDRIQIVSYGEEQPQCDESEEACFQLNRRVHFIIGQDAIGASHDR